MRCHPTAILDDDYDEMIHRTIEICQLTHYDPRCVVTCIMQNIMIRELANASDRSTSVQSSLDKLRDIRDMANDYGDTLWHSAIDETMDAVNNGVNIAANVAKGIVSPIPSFGYTIHGIMHAAFAASSRDSLSAKQIIAYCIAHGDDADTNGAIAGAIVGATETNKPDCTDDLLAAPQIVWNVQSYDINGGQP